MQKPYITGQEMNNLIEIRKIASDEPSAETISMLSSSKKEITTTSSSRFLKSFKIADKVKETKAKLDEESEKKKADLKIVRKDSLRKFVRLEKVAPR